MKKEYTYPEQKPQIVSDVSPEYALDTVIPVHVPSLGKYTMEELVDKLTDFALTLVNPKSAENIGKSYSARIMRLRANSNKSITVEDIEGDERLAYLINK